MTSNFWGHCAISVLKIKKHFAMFDYLAKMNLVLDVVHINATTSIWLLKGELYNNAEKSVSN